VDDAPLRIARRWQQDRQPLHQGRQDVCKKLRIDLPDRDLAYLPEDHPAFDAYLRELNWAQQFALMNRSEMMDRVLAELTSALSGAVLPDQGVELQRINCHHNFTQKERHFGREVWVTRKGAIQARIGMWAMIQVQWVRAATSSLVRRTR
jgi:tRNA-splicing ligase RtcB